MQYHHKISRHKPPCHSLKQAGFVMSVETLLFASLLVAGTVTGWIMIRDSINSELTDTANAIEGAIRLPYFSDPLRGNAPATVLNELHFTSPSGEGNAVFNGEDN